MSDEADLDAGDRMFPENYYYRYFHFSGFKEFSYSFPTSPAVTSFPNKGQDLILRLDLTFDVTTQKPFHHSPGVLHHIWS